MKKKDNLKILKFPNNIGQLERQVEAILFAAEEPLDIKSIQEKLKTNTNVAKTHAPYPRHVPSRPAAAQDFLCRGHTPP